MLHETVAACDNENDRDTKVIKLLLQSGANILSVDTAGHTPLHVACFQGNAKVARQLIKVSGVRSVNTVDIRGRIILHMAYTQMNGDVTMDSLLENAAVATAVKCLVNRTDSRGMTPLHLACLHGQEQAAKSLIKRGARVCCKNKSSRHHYVLLVESKAEAT